MVKDREGDLMFHIDSTLSLEKRERLLTALMSWSEAVKPSIMGAELKDQDTSFMATTEFSTFHWSFFSKYRQSVSFITGRLLGR